MSSDASPPSRPEEAYGPQGDPSRHLTRADLEAGWAALPLAPKDSGTLHFIVRRHPDGTRETLDRAHVTPESGVPGDRWGRKLPLNPEAQLTVMRTDVARMIANGQPLTMFGDNLFVDLDISAENLPIGTRLRLGGAMVVVTPKPHNGCLKFKGRFGQDGLEFVQAKTTRHQNFRGIYWRVVESGDIEVGDPVEVLSRAEP